MHSDVCHELSFNNHKMARQIMVLMLLGDRPIGVEHQEPAQIKQ